MANIYTNSANIPWSTIKRQLNPTHQDALDYLNIFGIDPMSRAMRSALTPEERKNAVRESQLSRRQSWERRMFGRVISAQWEPTMTLSNEHLTT